MQNYDYSLKEIYDVMYNFPKVVVIKGGLEVSAIYK